MKKLILIMLPLLAFAGRAWGVYVKIGGYELQPGSTHNHSNNSRIDSGTASLSSDAKTLTLTDMMFSTGKATGIEIHSDMTVVLEGFSELKLSSNHHGIIIYQGANVTITGKSLDIIASNRPCIEMFSGTSLKIKNVWSMRLSHVDYQSTYCILGNTAYCGDVTIEDSNVNFELCKNNLLKDLNSFTITGGESTYVTMSNDNKDLLSNVNNMTLGDYIKIVCDYTDPHFSSSAKTLVDTNGQPVRYYARFEYEYRVLLNQTNFPDNTFRMFIRNSQTLNPDLNDYLTQDEVNNIKTLDVSNKNISNLQGVEFLTKLTSLSCNQTNITALDVSALTALENLSCAYCTRLTSLNLYYDYTYGYSHNTVMKTLNVSGTKLTELNLDYFWHLENFSCSGCTSLKRLSMKNNEALETLTIRGMYGSELEYLDISGSAMKTLDCSNNQLTELSVAYCHHLETIDCSNNQLTALSTFRCYSLETIDCSNNKLDFLNIGLLYDNYDEKPKVLKSVNVSNNQLTQLILPDECPALETLNISNNQLTELPDLSTFAALEELNCEDNAITNTLSIVNIPTLQTLKTEGNDLQVLNVVNCPALATVTFTPTSMTALILNNTAITELTKHGGLFYTLNILNNPYLEALDLSSNSISTFSISNCPVLKTLNLSGNPLNRAALFGTAMPPNGNYANCCELLPALETVDFSNNGLYGLNVVGLEHLVSLDCGNAPNMYELYVAQCPILNSLRFDPVNHLSLSDTGLTELVYDGSVFQDENTMFVELFRNSDLTTFKWNNSNATRMHISSCNALATIDVSNNKLADLHLSECADNASVYCQNNMLDTNMASFMSNLPNKANRTVPSIYAFNAASGTDGNVCTMANVATATEKGWEVYYFDGTDWLPYLGCDYKVVPTAINPADISANTDANAYNLQGQRVGNDYKGIVIVNGKKVRR